MHLETDGLVVREQQVGEADRLITILTGQYGLQRAFVRRAKNLKSNLLAGTQLLCYSDFVLYQGKSANSVDSAQPKNVFFGLREDIDALSTAFYLSDLFSELAPENAPAAELLSLLLNSLYLLSNKKRDPQLVKSVAELRGLSDAGYMPDLVACRECGQYETPVMYFNPADAALYCAEHGQGKGLALSLSAVTAMRYIIYSEPKKVFDFQLSPPALAELNMATERFVLEQIRRHFKTLDFLKSLKELTPNEQETK